MRAEGISEADWHRWRCKRPLRMSSRAKRRFFPQTTLAHIHTQTYIYTLLHMYVCWHVHSTKLSKIPSGVFRCMASKISLGSCESFIFCLLLFILLTAKFYHRLSSVNLGDYTSLEWKEGVIRALYPFILHINSNYILPNINNRKQY